MAIVPHETARVRVRRRTVVAACAALAVLATAPVARSTTQTPAEVVLSRAREALGGREKLDGVTSLQFTGAIVAIDQTVPAAYRRMPFEMRAFPDRFVEIITGPVGPTVTGVDGSHLLYVPIVPPAAPVPAQTTMPPAGLIDVSRQTFVMWMLLGLLRTDTVWPLTVEPRVETSAAYETLQFLGRDELVLFLDVDRANATPVRVRYRTATQAGASVEAMLVAEDRRDVSGVRLPFRVRHFRNGRPFMNYREFERVQVNVTLPDFESLRYQP